MSIDAQSSGTEGVSRSRLELHHDLYLVLREWGSWAAVAEALSCAGAELQSLQLLRQGENWSGRCRLKNVSSEEVRQLSSMLIDSGVARQASVEHLMLRRAAVGPES